MNVFNGTDEHLGNALEHIALRKSTGATDAIVCLAAAERLAALNTALLTLRAPVTCAEVDAAALAVPMPASGVSWLDDPLRLAQTVRHVLDSRFEELLK